MEISEFQALLKPIVGLISQSTIDETLEEALNQQFPAQGDLFLQIEHACHQAIAAGWMCSQGADGRRFGRVIEPSAETGHLSVDVVDLVDIAGPHHRHPSGEICMVLPVDESAVFDGHPRGWVVNEPDSAHRPTVTHGRALILYLLPDGLIEFS